MDKDFDYYLTLPLIEMGRSNMLIRMDDDIRLGAYYLMKIYHLGFHHCTRGSWEWVCFSRGEDGDWLTGEEIKNMDPDMEEYNKHRREFEAGIYPEGWKGNSTLVNASNFEYTGKFGWLSPTGEFTESEWGTHEQSAFDIIDKYGWEDEYLAYEDRSALGIAGDFICSVKRYVLIHNPSMDGGYCVTNVKPLTKKQKEFLYDYFMALGNVSRANMYMEDT